MVYFSKTSKSLGIAWLLAFSIMAPIYCIPPIENVISNQLMLSHTQTIFLYSAPLLMVTVLGIPGGILTDNIGIKKTVGLGIILVVLGSLLRGFFSDANYILAFTFLYGAGIGLVFPNLQKIVSASVARERAGMATGIFATGILTATALPLAITASVVLPMTKSIGGVFIVWSMPAIVSAVLWWTVIRVPQETSQAAVSTGVSPSSSVFRNINVWLAAILFFLHDFFFGTWAAWMPTLLQMKAATPQLAGIMSSLTVWAGIPTVFFIPRLSYKLGVRKHFLWVTSIATAILAFAAIDVSLGMSWALMAVAGVVLEARFVTIMALPVELVSYRDVGRASGLLLSIGFLGGVIGSLFSGSLLDRFGHLNSMLLTLTCLSIGAAVIAFKLPETGHKRLQNG
jgi:CP family cyanate transporter-like MFS transporter